MIRFTHVICKLQTITQHSYRLKYFNKYLLLPILLLLSCNNNNNENRIFKRNFTTFKTRGIYINMLILKN